MKTRVIPQVSLTSSSRVSVWCMFADLPEFYIKKIFLFFMFKQTFPGHQINGL